MDSTVNDICEVIEFNKYRRHNINLHELNLLIQ